MYLDRMLRIMIILMLSGHLVAAQNSGNYNDGRFHIMDQLFKEIIDVDAGIEALAEGHDWTEGPLWIEDHQMLLYNDIPRNTIYKWTDEDGSVPYLHPSGFTGENFKGREPGANGLALDQEGNLIMCQHGDRRLARMNAEINRPRSKFETVADRYQGKRFNSPNDLVIKSNGDIYFTDPPYGLPGQMDDPEKEIEFQGVYKLDNKGNVSLLTNEFTRPNGIAFSPDESFLYVANSDPDMAIWKVFEVTDKGDIRNGMTLYDATSNVSDYPGLPDGLKINNNGIIFASGPGGIYVFSPDHKLLGMIMTGQATSNCALNSDQTELFITADGFVLRVRLKPMN